MPTRRQRAVAKLTGLLQGEGIAQGSRLPPERDLCRQLELSRSALREGLEVLEAEGRIWRHVGQGTFVGSRPAPAPAALNLITSLTSPAEVLETRMMLEPLLARMAALRATEAEVQEMQRLLEKSEAARDAKTWELWDGRLHRAVAEAAHNGLLLSIFDAFNAVRGQANWGALRRAALTPERHAAYCAHHRAYVAAIASRNPAEAEALMRRHIEAVRDGLLGMDPGATVAAAE
jgi:DNA-binding FadR family transcriptional regulator